MARRRDFGSWRDEDEELFPVQYAFSAFFHNLRNFRVIFRLESGSTEDSN